MHRNIILACNARVLRDSYGTLYETAAPDFTGLRQLGFAVVTVDVGKRSPAAYHEHTEELYYVTDGRGRMYLGDASQEVGPGDTICIPLRTVHSIENIGADLLRFVCATAPPYDPGDDIETESTTAPPVE